MNERNFCVSAPQLFCFVLFYLLSGMMLFSGGSFFASLFSALFSACLCVISAGICKGIGSSAELYAGAFGAASPHIRLLAAFFSALPLAGTLSAFSVNVHVFHGEGQPLALAPVLAAFCILSVSGGFMRAARFSELCVFALIGASLLALFGGGEGASFAFEESALFSGFYTIGAPAVFFSLYARCATPKSGKMSDFAASGAFHPSPLSAGICAVCASLILYAYFCFVGNNILFALLSWFFLLARLLLLSLAMADLLAYPEKKEGTKCALISCAFCAFWLIFASLSGDITGKIQVFAAVILPCVIFICSVFARERKCAHR